MATFNSGKNLAIVIQLQKTDKEKALSLLQERANPIFGRGRYAYILHDKDVLDTGEIKGNHIHLVFSAEVAKSSANWLKHFADNLGIDETAISVEMMGSERKVVRYLLHLDDPTKHQYDRSEVITNMPDTCKKHWDANTAFNTSPTLDQLLEARKSGWRGIYNLVGLASCEKAFRVAQTLVAEDDYITAMLKDFEDAYNTLCAFTSNPKYLERKAIPYKDFEDLLDEFQSKMSHINLLARQYKENK